MAKLYLCRDKVMYSVEVPYRVGPTIEIGALHEGSMVTRIDYSKRVYRLDNTRDLKFPPVFNYVDEIQGGIYLTVCKPGDRSKYRFQEVKANGI